MATPCGMWDPSSLTRNWTHTLCIWSTEPEPLDQQGSPCIHSEHLPDSEARTSHHFLEWCRYQIALFSSSKTFSPPPCRLPALNPPLPRVPPSSTLPITDSLVAFTWDSHLSHSVCLICFSSLHTPLSCGLLEARVSLCWQNDILQRGLGNKGVRTLELCELREYPCLLCKICLSV